MAQEHLMIFLHSFINVERQILTSIYLINLPALPPSKTVLLSVQPNYLLPVYTTCSSGHMWFQNN